MSRPVPDRPGPGQESVWDYPRPPRLEPTRALVEVVLGGVRVATTRAAFRVLETSHPPTYYLPADAFAPGTLRSAEGSSFCEWKGRAVYPAAMDRCTVDGETVVPQPGGFYGGWVTSAVAGPFKGGPGTHGW